MFQGRKGIQGGEMSVCKGIEAWEAYFYVCRIANNLQFQARHEREQEKQAKPEYERRQSCPDKVVNSMQIPDHSSTRQGQGMLTIHISLMMYIIIIY